MSNGMKSRLRKLEGNAPTPPPSADWNELLAQTTFPVREAYRRILKAKRDAAPHDAEAQGIEVEDLATVPDGVRQELSAFLLLCRQSRSAVS